MQANKIADNQGVMPSKFIDIDKIFKDKNPKVYQMLPKFVLAYLKRVIHQDSINEFQQASKHLVGLEYLEACLNFVGAKVSYTGIEHLPEVGGVIVASNHPLGGLDGMALMKAVSEKRPDIHFLVNDILTNLKNFGDLFIPVNKIGSNSTDNLRRIDKIYQTSHVKLVFPAGLVSRKSNSQIRDLSWNKSFVTKAVQYEQPIVPVHINGRLSNFFYKLSQIRKAIGIKANIEMLFLANEMFKQKNQTLQITFGNPILSKQLGGPKNHQNMAYEIMEYVYAIGSGETTPFEYWQQKKLR